MAVRHEQKTRKTMKTMLRAVNARRFRDSESVVYADAVIGGAQTSLKSGMFWHVAVLKLPSSRFRLEPRGGYNSNQSLLKAQRQAT